MSGSRYFYADALAAAWMVDHHDLIVVEENGLVHCESETILDSHVGGCYRGKYFIHPDSLPLLEPRIGDMVRVPIEGNVFNWLGMMVDDEEDVALHSSEEIIQRDGKAFHWPISDAA